MRRINVLILGCFIASLALVGVATPAASAHAASAASTVSPAADPTTVTADPLPTWQTDGKVWATASVGSVVYVGGEFSSVRPPGAALGTNETPRVNFAAFNATTGNLVSCSASFAQTTGSSPASIEDIEASPDGSVIYVAGLFNSVNGTSVRNLVALNSGDCSLDSGFAPPTVNQRIWAVKASATAVYFGGKFTKVNGQTRTRLGAVDTSGALLSWAPTADSDVRALDISPDGTLVYAGGDFFDIDGQTIHAMVALDSTSGAVEISYPDWEPYANARITGIAHDSSHLYVAAEGFGQPTFEGRLAGDLYDNGIYWRDDCKGANQDVLPYNGVLYSASHTHKCTTTPGGWQDQEMGGRQHFIANAIDEGGLILPWFPDTDEGDNGTGLGPWHLTMADNVLWAGGEFTQVNGQPQQSLTRFGFSSTTSSPPEDVPVVKATSTIAGQATIRWRATWDRDNGPLTYHVYRDGTLIDTTVYDSRFFRRPMLYDVDTGVAPGTRHSYQVDVSDGETTLPLSTASAVKIASANASYPSQVLADGATLYWRLGEPPGATTATSQTGTDNGTYHGGVTLGVPGAIAGDSDTAATFDGSTGDVVDGTQQKNPQAYSVEAWFKTTTTKGGKLIGFGTSQTGSSSDTDRTVYMDNAGHLTFGAWHDTTRVTITTTVKYNDGRWHDVVATGGPLGMSLYVDGSLVGSDSNQWAQIYNGYWKIGNDLAAGWPNSGSSGTGKPWAGTLDEVAVYPFQISSAVVVAHDAAGVG